jgi:WD40 repeat protein
MSWIEAYRKHARNVVKDRSGKIYKDLDLTNLADTFQQGDTLPQKISYNIVAMEGSRLASRLEDSISIIDIDTQQNDIIFCPETSQKDTDVFCYNSELQQFILQPWHSKKLFIYGRDGTFIKHFDMQDEFCGGLPNAHSFGDYILAGCASGYVNVWHLTSDEKTIECVSQFLAEPNVGVSCTLVLNERQLISGGRDHCVRIWDVGSGECQIMLQRHSDWINNLAAIDDQFFASACWNGEIRIWNSVTATQTYFIALEQDLTCMISIARGNYLVFLCSSCIGFIDVKTGAKCTTDYADRNALIAVEGKQGLMVGVIEEDSLLLFRVSPKHATKETILFQVMCLKSSKTADVEFEF